jgi:uncharacterized protein (DUF433 family)
VSVTIPAEQTIPLQLDEHGMLRVSNTRVPLDNLIHEFLGGASAEEIVAAYPSVPLADVYTLIGHYLHHRAEIDAYLARNRAETTAAVEQGRHAQAGLRDQLLARLKARENSSAAVPGG